MTDTPSPTPEPSRTQLAHPKRWVAVGIATLLVGIGTTSAVLAVSGAASYNTRTKTVTMQPGDQVAATCPNPLSWAQVSGSTGRLNCALPVVTTTTTVSGTTTTAPTLPPTTTTAPTIPATTTTTTGTGNTTACKFASAPAGDPAAFCDSFDNPAGTGNRSGQLNGTLWGVSRASGFTNFGQQQYADIAPTVLNKCGTNVTVSPPQDVQICNGQVTEAGEDQHGVTSLAMYPKQPFDMAGRTGTMSFDVSNDSHGIHRVWPEIWYTDTPAPAPFTHFDSLQEVPKNAVGIRLAAACSLDGGLSSCQGRYPNVPTGPWVSVDSAAIVTNYAVNDTAGGPTPSTLNVQVLNAVRPASGPGNNNHFEIRFANNQIDVYGTDAGTTGPLIHLAVITNFTMPLTRGLLWAEDVHYNGDKDGIDQGTHTFTWDNFGFDGPRLPRDLTFDVLDANTPCPCGGGIINEGWNVPTDGTNTVSVHTLPVTAANIAAGSGAALLVNYFTYTQATLSYKVNNGPWQSQAWPFPTCTQLCGPRTIALPVNKADVVVGANTIQFKATDSTAVSNIDLALLGAGG